MIEKKGNLWVLSFEYAGIAKVGGLGEVPANQVKYLSKKYNVFVILPSHGQIDRLKMDNTWEKLSINCIGSFNPQILGERESEMKYDISFYRFKINDTNFLWRSDLLTPSSEAKNSTPNAGSEIWLFITH